MSTKLSYISCFMYTFSIICIVMNDLTKNIVCLVSD